MLTKTQLSLVNFPNAIAAIFPTTMFTLKDNKTTYHIY